MLKTIFSLIGKERKRQALLLLPVMLFGSLLEMLGISMIVSVCSLLVNDQWMLRGRLAVWLRGLLPFKSENGLMIGVLLALIALYVFKLLYLTWENYIVARFARLSRSEVSNRLFRRFVYAPYTFFIRHSTAELQNLLGRDIAQLGTGLSACMDLLLEGLVALGMCLFLLLVDPVMTAFVAAGAFLFLLLTRLLLGRAARRASERQRRANRARGKWLHMVVAGIKDIRIGRHEAFFSARFAEAEAEFVHTECLKQFWTKLPALCIETIMVLSVLLYMLFLIFSGQELTRFFPSLSAFAVASIRLLPTCRRINSSLTQLSYVRASVEAIRLAFEETEPVEPPKARMGKEAAFTEGISVRGVSYAYEGGVGTVLANVSLDVPAGTSVGIVGPSGMGKTTLLDLLLGLLTPQEGEILIDGVPIGECLESYLQKVAYVPQTTFLMDDSIRCNVALGADPGAVDDGEVWAALEKAALAEMVRALPEGLDTQIGEGGIRLSGGERQRLSLARAMYRQAGVIVFDEATSALDQETETEVLDSINALKGEKTVLIVSHRPTAIANCDRVYRVENGRVDEIQAPGGEG